MKKLKEVKNRMIIKREGFDVINLEYEKVKGKKIIDLLRLFGDKEDWSCWGMLIGDRVLKNKETVESYKDIETMFVPISGVVKHITAFVLN